jgi:hypothetical protein
LEILFRLGELHSFTKHFSEFTQNSLRVPERTRKFESLPPVPLKRSVLPCFAQAIADAIAAQNTTSHRLAKLSEEIKELNGSVTAMEKLLQGV